LFRIFYFAFFQEAIVNARLISVFFPVFLAGCAGALVSSNQTKSAASGLSTLRSIEQAALLGAYSSPRSFDLVAPEYVQAIDSFRAASPRASSGEARDAEQERLRTAFDNCIEGIRTLARIHRTSGLSDDESDFLILDGCRSATDALERSR
jgi:hypothetical protein